jgi:hypothetical protein
MPVGALGLGPTIRPARGAPAPRVFELLRRIARPLDSTVIPWVARAGGAGHEEAPQPVEVTGRFWLRGWDLNPRPSGYEIARNSARSPETERKANPLDLPRFHKPTFRVLQPLRWPLNPSGPS